MITAFHHHFIVLALRRWFFERFRIAQGGSSCTSSMYVFFGAGYNWLVSIYHVFTSPLVFTLSYPPYTVLTSCFALNWHLYFAWLPSFLSAPPLPSTLSSHSFGSLHISFLSLFFSNDPCVFSSFPSLLGLSPILLPHLPLFSIVFRSYIPTHSLLVLGTCHFPIPTYFEVLFCFWFFSFPSCLTSDCLA